MSADKTVAGDQLFRLLPEVYRHRDDGDLEALLDGFGHVLDLVRNTLEQRYADNFPDAPFDGPPDDPFTRRASQDWLLPYFADLVDARLRSPFVDGRREEVSQAVAWRQRKGTLRAVERIAEAVSQFEVEVQEGWKRVAITPRVDTPLLPATALGEPPHALDQRPPDAPQNVLEIDPLVAARHPALPAATVDFRRPSRAVQTEEGAAGAKLTSFATGKLAWRQINRHGLPCFPGSYEDVSRRTVDVRTPTWSHGHFHPKRLLLHVPPPLGPFGDDPIAFDTLADAETGKAVEKFIDNDTKSVTSAPTNAGPVLIRNALEISDGFTHRYERILFASDIEVTEGRLELDEGAARAVRITTADTSDLGFKASDSLLESITAPAALVQLEYCTVLGNTESLRLDASDSIFVGDIALGAPSEPQSCIRYSRVPPGTDAPDGLRLHQTTDERPIFFEYRRKTNGAHELAPAPFGEPGCGVLHPATSESIRFGAQDGGEMGAYHVEAHSLAMAAIVEKLRDYLSIGLEAVVIYDRRLLVSPPVSAAQNNNPGSAGP